MTATTCKIILSELQIAVAQMPAKEISRWSFGVAKNLALNAVRRAKNIYKLADGLTSGAGDELALFARHARKGDVLRYLHMKKDSVKELICSAGFSAKTIANLIKKNPKQGAVQIAAFVLGFYAGSGGLDGDGGIPDLDLVLGGAGMHRSPVTHSIIIGILIDSLALSLIEFIEAVYVYLPRKHSIVWDRTVLQTSAVIATFAGATSLGLAYHFFIDSFIDSGKAYVGLPFSMPQEMHQAVMLANGVIEATDAAHKLGGGTSEERQAVGDCVNQIGQLARIGIATRRDYCQIEARLNILRQIQAVKKDVFGKEHIEEMEKAAAKTYEYKMFTLVNG